MFTITKSTITREWGTVDLVRTGATFRTKNKFQCFVLEIFCQTYIKVQNLTAKQSSLVTIYYGAYGVHLIRNAGSGLVREK